LIFCLAASSLAISASGTFRRAPVRGRTVRLKSDLSCCCTCTSITKSVHSGSRLRCVGFTHQPARCRTPGVQGELRVARRHADAARDSRSASRPSTGVTCLKSKMPPPTGRSAAIRLSSMNHSFASTPALLALRNLLSNPLRHSTQEAAVPACRQLVRTAGAADRHCR
jgi:hypothetical protein